MRFFNILYNLLFHPAQEFKVIAMGPVPKDLLLAYGAALVFFVSALGALYSPLTMTTDGLLFNMLIAGFTGIIFWMFTGTVFSTAAYVFGVRGRPLTLLILTAFATVPWLLLPVVMLFKGVLGTLGNTLAIFGALGLWLWSTILFLMALKYTYDLSLERILLAASLPVLMTFLGFSWVGGFFFNLLQFFS